MAGADLGCLPVTGAPQPNNPAHPNILDTTKGAVPCHGNCAFGCIQAAFNREAITAESAGVDRDSPHIEIYGLARISVIVIGNRWPSWTTLERQSGACSSKRYRSASRRPCRNRFTERLYSSSCPASTHLALILAQLVIGAQCIDVLTEAIIITAGKSGFGGDQVQFTVRDDRHIMVLPVAEKPLQMLIELRRGHLVDRIFALDALAQRALAAGIQKRLAYPELSPLVHLIGQIAADGFRSYLQPVLPVLGRPGAVQGLPGQVGYLIIVHEGIAGLHLRAELLPDRPAVGRPGLQGGDAVAPVLAADLSGQLIGLVQTLQRLIKDLMHVLGTDGFFGLLAIRKHKVLKLLTDHRIDQRRIEVAAHQVHLLVQGILLLERLQAAHCVVGGPACGGHINERIVEELVGRAGGLAVGQPLPPVAGSDLVEFIGDRGVRGQNGADGFGYLGLRPIGQRGCRGRILQVLFDQPVWVVHFQHIAARHCYQEGGGQQAGYKAATGGRPYAL